MSDEQNTKLLAPDFKPKRKFDELGDHLLRIAGTRRYYGRARIHRGTKPRQFPRADRKFPIPGTTERSARENLRRLLDQFDQFELGRAENPFAKVAARPSIATITTLYLTLGCPTKDGRAREGKQLAEEKRRVSYIVKHLGRLPHDQLSAATWHEYHEIRRAHSSRKQFQCDRAVDLEWNTLVSVYRVADAPFPIKQRIRFRKPGPVRHARAGMPRSGDELHRIAYYLMSSDPFSQPLAWLALFQAAIGHRIETLVALKNDPAPEQPGYFDAKRRVFYLLGKDGHKGAKGFRVVDAEFRLLYSRWKRWINQYAPGSPWMFPSPKDPSCHVAKDSLTPALVRASEALALPRRFSHGLRAFRANVLLSRGIQYLDVAKELGHTDASCRELRQVYGEALPYRLDWMPGDRSLVAWRDLFPKPETAFVTDPAALRGRDTFFA